MFRNSVSQRLLPQRHRVCVTDVAKPRLKALCLSTTPNIIFGATVKDTLSKADDIFNFQCPQSKTTKKHSQRPHLEQLDTLCLQGSIFNPAKLIVSLKIVRIFNLSAAAALFWSSGRKDQNIFNQPIELTVAKVLSSTYWGMWIVAEFCQDVFFCLFALFIGYI